MSLERGHIEFSAEMPSDEWAVISGVKPLTMMVKPWVDDIDLIDHDLKQMREIIQRMNRETKVRLWRSKAKKGKHR